MTVRRLSLLVAVLAALSAGCGGASSPPLLPSADVSLLRADVQSIRSRVAEGRDIAARQAASALGGHIRQLISAHRLASSDGQRLLAAVRQAEGHIPVARAATPAPAATTTQAAPSQPTATPAPAPAPSQPAQGEKSQPAKGPKPHPGKGAGHGNGNGGDGGGD